jgi:hypothetical protein
VVERWNEQLAAGREMLWSPTIRAAMLAGTPWLDVFCPGCGAPLISALTGICSPRSVLWCSAAMLMVPGLGTDAEAVGAFCVAAGSPRRG